MKRFDLLFNVPILAFAVGSVAACAPPEQGSAAVSPLPVATMAVQARSAYSVSRRFNGVVRSGRSSALGFERPGRVIKVFVDEGDVVSRGQLVAELDPAKLAAARRRLVASLQEANAGVGIAELTAQRLQKLANERFTSKQSSDEARFGLRAAQAKQDTLRASIREIDVELGKTKLYAPFAGQVAARLVDEGTVVGAATPIIRFLEKGAKEAIVGVPASVARTVEVGRAVDVRVGDRTVAATIKHRVADIDPRTRTVSLIFALPDAYPTTDGEVVIFDHRHPIVGDGFWVPTTALTQGLRGLWSLYVVDGGAEAPSRIRREEVHVLYAETDQAYVRGTLEDGDRIVVTGLHRVVPGQMVSAEPLAVRAHHQQR